MDRLQKQVEFILEADKVKNILRMTRIADGSRRENDAEHQWHMALMAILLSEHTVEDGIDLLKVIKMILIHDLVEIDAGDTFCYDQKGNLDKKEREEIAAKRIFGILPEDQGEELKALWEEFDEMKTPEAKYAAALDRLQPVLLNYMNQGGTWGEHHITKEQVIKRNRPIENGSPKLWAFVEGLIEDAVRKGYLKESAEEYGQG